MKRTCGYGCPEKPNNRHEIVQLEGEGNAGIWVKSHIGQFPFSTVQCTDASGAVVGVWGDNPTHTAMSAALACQKGGEGYVQLVKDDGEVVFLGAEDLEKLLKLIQ